MGVNDWGRKGRIWGQLVAVREVRLLPLGPKGPQLTATVFDTTGTRTVTCWNLPPAQILLLVAAQAYARPNLRISGTIGTAGAGEVTLCGITPADS